MKGSLLFYTNHKASAVTATPERDFEDYQPSDTSFFSTSVHGFTKIKGHGMRLSLISKPIADSQLASSIQCTSTYCNLEPSSSRITVGLRNASNKKITIPAKAAICQEQLANMLPKLYAMEGHMSIEANQEEDWHWKS